MDNQEKLKQLFKEGIKAMDNNELRLARRKFRQIAAIEPTNSIAQEKLKEIDTLFEDNKVTVKGKEKKNMVIFGIVLAIIFVLYIAGTIAAEF